MLRSRLLAVLSCSLAAGWATGVHAEGPAQHPGRVLVQFSQDLPGAARGLYRKLVGGKVRHAYHLVPGLEALEVSVGSERAVAALAEQAGVLYAEPDFHVTAAGVPDDPRFPELWGMQRIKAPVAWNTATGSSSFVVAVIDEGIDFSHPDLAANAWVNPGEIAGNGIDDDGNGYVDDVNGWDFVNGDATVYDAGDGDHHGTHVSGTIAGSGNNGVGVAGVNWRVSLMSLKFLGPQGGYTSDAIAALDYAVAKGAKVSNNSWGGGGYSSAMSAALDRARDAGHLFVAAAGNDAKDTDLVIRRGKTTVTQQNYPSGYDQDNVVAVAAIDSTDNLAYYSNWGATSIDLAAPGSGILSTLPGNTYGSYNGTSMATPHVAGAAALLWSMHPGWSYADVRTQLLATTEPLPSLAGKVASGGLLDLAAMFGPANLSPSVAIASPAAGAVATQGSPVTFAGSGTDPEDGSVSASLVWKSNLSGTIGTGAGFTRSDLPAGSHLIRVTATDSKGRTGYADTTLIVEAPRKPRR